MEIQIEDKKFSGRFILENGHQYIHIPLSSDDDILFFAKWSMLRDGMSIKSEYTKNLPFETIARKGEIREAFPILDMNEEFVRLKFDHLTTDWKMK